MANPNLFSATTLSLLSKGALISTAATTIIGAVTTNHVVIVDQFLLSNKSSVNTVDAVVGFYDSSATITVYPINTITLYAKSSINIASSLAPMNEGDLLTVTSSMANGIDALIGYKDVS